MGCSPLLMVDMYNNSFYSLSENKLVSLGSGATIGSLGSGATIGGGGGGGAGITKYGDADTNIVGSSHGWLVLFTSSNHEFLLWNPTSQERIHLPPIRDLHIPSSNVEDGTACVTKVILSSSPDDADCRAVMIYGIYDRLAFCCPGRSVDWILIGDSYFHDVDDGECKVRSYVDIVYSTTQKRLLCITEYQQLERWDLGDPCSPRIDGSNECEFDNGPDIDTEPKSFQLVVAEQSNKVYVLVRNIRLKGIDNHEDEDEEEDEEEGSCVVTSQIISNAQDPYKTLGFDVYRVDEEGEGGILTISRVEEEESLDGLAMFIGMNHSFALSAFEFPELKPNSIYFTDPIDLSPRKMSWWSTSYGNGLYDIGIFGFQKQIFYPCYSPPQPQPEPESEQEDDEYDRRDGLLPRLVWFIPTSH